MNIKEIIELHPLKKDLSKRVTIYRCVRSLELEFTKSQYLVLCEEISLRFNECKKRKIIQSDQGSNGLWVKVWEYYPESLNEILEFIKKRHKAFNRKKRTRICRT